MPQQRITLSQRVFYLGLFIMLAAGILSPALSVQVSPAVPVIVLAGAFTALASRIWHYRIHQTARRSGNIANLT